MNVRHTLASLIAIAVLFDPSSAQAQRLTPSEPPPGPPRLDVSGTGGLLLSSDWSDLVLLGTVSPATGALQQVLVRDIVVDPGPVYDGTVTYWEGRYGFRAHAGYARSCVAVARSCGEIGAVTGDTGLVNVKSYSYDIGGAIGLLPYRAQRWVWPYVFFGAGGVTYDLARTIGPPLTFIERQPAVGDRAALVRDSDPLLISIEELGLETRFAVNFGVGTDFRIPLGPAGLGVRFEVSDHLHDSPVNVQVLTLDGFLTERQLRFGPVHNLRAAVGVVLHVGRE